MGDDDFNRRFDRQQRRIRRFSIGMTIYSFIVVAALLFAACWLIAHPTEIGAFFGKIVSGFRSAS